MFVCPECGRTEASGGHCRDDGARLVARGEDVLVGQTVGVYRIARLLGVGGMGRVYLGVHPTIGSRVAIKVLSRECADRPDLVERFFSEARAVNVIRHESLVNVIDLARLDDGRPYIVMEFLDGAPLSDLVARGGPMPLGGLARLAAEALDGLGAAHAKGVVHRDLKPDNLFVTPNGRPKILDFGIAKLRPELGAAATRTGSLLGTPHYMAPEQAMARPIDARTDLYAFGVILYECATGRRPFDSESLFDLLRQHVDEPPPPPRQLRPDMPAAYEQVILVAMAKDPANRFASAAALAQALLGAAQGLPADQWVPVTPATAAQLAAQRTPISGWGSAPSGQGPTVPQRPPMTRAGEPSVPGVAVIGGGHVPTGPGAPTPPSLSHGQVVPAPAPPASRAALWFAVAIVALSVVAGAVVVVVSDSGDPVAASSPSPTPIPAPSPSPSSSPSPSPNPSPSLSPSPSPTPSPSPSPSPTARRRPAAPPVLEKPDPPPPPPPPAKPTGQDWIALQQSLTRRLDFPAGFSASAFDVARYLPTAEKAVRAIYPDATLYRIDADGVMPDGRANLTLGDSLYVDYRFISKANSARPANIPIGVDYEEKCILRVIIDRSSINVRPITGWECDETPIPHPRCTPAQVWKKMIARGAPDGNVVGELGYRATFAKKAVWYASIEGTTFSEIIADDC